MISTLELMQEIRRRPGMYLGAPSISKLAPFLDGFHFATYKMGVVEQRYIVADFRDWIQARYKTTTAGWQDLILLDSKDEAEAFDHCWRLFDEFLAAHPEHRSPSAETPAHAAPRIAAESVVTSRSA